MEPKILSIADYYPDTTNPTRSLWIYEQVYHLSSLGYTSLVVSPSPYIPKLFRKTLFKKPEIDYKIKDYNGTLVFRPLVIKFPRNKFYGVYINSLKLAISIASKFIKPKLIHAHFGPNGIAAIKIKKKLRIPLVTSFYGYDCGRLASFLKKYYKDLIKYGDIFLALSEDMRRDLIILGFPDNRIIVHHLGIDTDFVKEIKKKELPHNKFIYTIVARFDEVKGIHDAIRAFNLLSLKKNNLELRIVGDGIYRDNLKSLVQQLGLNKSVIFVNNFESNNPREVVLNELNNCDVFILTSYTTKDNAKEGTPIVLMEAQAFSKPCIATRHAGIPEVVIDKKTGLLVNERDINAIADSMLMLMENEQLRTELGMNARIHIEKEFNLKIQIEKLANIYSQLING